MDIILLSIYYWSQVYGISSHKINLAIDIKMGLTLTFTIFIHIQGDEIMEAYLIMKGKKRKVRCRLEIILFSQSQIFFSIFKMYTIDISKIGNNDISQCNIHVLDNILLIIL